MGASRRNRLLVIGAVAAAWVLVNRLFYQLVEENFGLFSFAANGGDIAFFAATSACLVPARSAV